MTSGHLPGRALSRVCWGMEQGRGRGARDPGWPGGLFLNSPLQAPLAFLGVGVGAGSNCCKNLRTTCKAFVKIKRQGIENVLYSMPHLSQVKISSNQYKGKERREKEKKQKTKEAAMANALITWSLILCYYLFDSLSKIK